MKVFAITANGSYCTGTAVVAAKNEQDAVDCASQIQNKTFAVRWDKPYIVKLLEDVSSKAKVPTVLYQYATGE